MGGFGPALPLLQSDQGTSAAVAGLHGTALGIASIIAGYLNAPLVHRFGRYRTSWIGLLIFNIGGLGFVIFPDPILTIPSMLIAGIGISTTINNTIAFISNHYPDHQTRAVSQNNAVNSGFWLIGTILIGLMASTAISWRLGLLISIPYAIALYILAGRKFKPEHIPDIEGRQRGSLPRKYWWAWLGLLFTISAEFAIAYWAAALLRERTGISPSTATALIFAYALGMVIGRWFGTYLFPKLDPDRRLQIMLMIQALGFLALWVSEITIISVLALFVIGLGTSLQFILTTLRMLKFGAEKSDLAIGKSSLAAGIAIGASPFLLGLLADLVGISSAFLVVPLFIALAFIIVVLVPNRVEAV
jgi:predicted MFS family arabinose efflux permease